MFSIYIVLAYVQIVVNVRYTLCVEVQLNLQLLLFADIVDNSI